MAQRVDQTVHQDGNLHDRSIPELMKELADETTTLVRQELDLAKAEMVQKGKNLVPGAGMFAAAALLGMLALGALTAFFIAAIASALPVWASALIVGVVYLIVAGVLAMMGKSRIQQATPLKPDETIQSVKEDVQWVKTRTQSGTR